MRRRSGLWLGCGILALLALPGPRAWLEADMERHMLMQFPLLIGAGLLVGHAVPERVRRHWAAWNHHGISGLLLVSCVLAFWMVPRALDEVLIVPWLEAVKFASLLLTGAALAVSWPLAGLLVRGFFLGNLLPMMAVTGWLYAAAPVRLCNAYLTSQQQAVGQALIAFSLLAACTWLAGFFRAGSRTYEANTNR
jgi:hypothetical protein